MFPAGSYSTRTSARPAADSRLGRLPPGPLKVGALFRNGRYRRCGTLLLGIQMTHSLGLWMRYLNLAYPAKPAD
jgi:hypothetical protein